MTIIYRQCNEATKTEIALRATYDVDCQDGILIKFLKQVRTVCFGSDNGELLFGPYKSVVAVKSMNNYSNNKPNNPHGFKEEVNVKYDAVKAVVEKFPNGIGAMIELLGTAVPALDWVSYCAMSPADQLVWEEMDDNLTKSMLFLMNSKNSNAKKDICLAYSQRNITAHLPTIKTMARNLSTQHPNKNSIQKRQGKKGDRNRNKGDIPKSKGKDNNTTGTAGAYVEDIATSEDSNVSSGGASIGIHILEATGQLS